MLKGFASTGGDLVAYSRQSVHLSPKMNRIAQYSGCDLAQPGVFLLEHIGTAAVDEGFLVAFQDGRAGILRLQCQVAGCDGEHRTGG